MTRTKREWNPKFIKYMKSIIKHPNYKDMPDIYKSDGSIRWVVSKKSKIGEKRLRWWQKKALELGIPLEGQWISKVAKKIHPTKKKVCQICGKEMSIEYVYPTKNLIKKLNRIEGFEDKFKYNDFQSIDKILSKVIQTLGNKGFKYFSEIFKIPNHIEKTIDEYWNFIYNNYVVLEKRILSPGAMSNAPDRLDGFHSYNICCRSSEDKGRHKENLARYREDRRAYEHWADGDWKVASSLMQSHKGKCVICGKETQVTADHIGPISLGFAHLPHFQPLCKSCNSAKNNRMFFQDVKKLIELEEKGEVVISWHSKYIWDGLKKRINNDEDAKKLSKLMRTSHHYFMELFYFISINGYKDFLMQYLHPEYAYYEKIEFTDLNPSTFEYKKIKKKEGNKKQYQNNAARYIRIAFESLEEYHKKRNRKLKKLSNMNLDQEFNDILTLLKKDTNFNPKLRDLLERAFKQADKERKEEIIKKALKEYNRSPTRNNTVDKKVKEVLKKIADHLIEKW
ncbi:MAG: Alw26I/Eco31I/Esp3I family type II restriction endonuclease [Candidatus Helarchaeota archaeon]